MRKNIIDENFVDELCKSGVWDLMSPEKGCNITEAFGDSPGDVPAQRKATHARITAIRKRGGMTPEGERTMRQRVTSGRTDPRRTSTGRSGMAAGMPTPRQDSSTQVEDTDEVSARELAEELFENLSDDIIYECIDILHSTLLNEEDSLDEETLTEDIILEMDDDDFDSLINEAIAVLDEEYDLSEATEEDLIEAIIDELRGASQENIDAAEAADKKRGWRKKMEKGISRGGPKHVRQGIPQDQSDYTSAGGKKHSDDWIEARAGKLRDRMRQHLRNRARRESPGAQLDKKRADFDAGGGSRGSLERISPKKRAAEK